MKYQRTRTTFLLPDGSKVRPFNGEKRKMLKKNGKREYDVSWSHGFTHMQDIDTDKVSVCGTQWFEENAMPIGKTNDKRRSGNRLEKTSRSTRTNQL
jgi:hypothetical protein